MKDQALCLQPGVTRSIQAGPNGWQAYEVYSPVRLYHLALAGQNTSGVDSTFPDQGVTPSLEPGVVVNLNEIQWTPLIDPEAAVGQVFDTGDQSRRVVGVVANARTESLRAEALPTIYEQLDPMGALFSDHVAIRAEIDAGALAAAVQQAVARVDPAVPLAEFHTQSGLIDRLLRTERLLALVSRGHSLAALALAAIGLGGLLAYAVARRTHERSWRPVPGHSRRSGRSVRISGGVGSRARSGYGPFTFAMVMDLADTWWS